MSSMSSPNGQMFIFTHLVLLKCIVIELGSLTYKGQLKVCTYGWKWFSQLNIKVYHIIFVKVK